MPDNNEQQWHTAGNMGPDGESVDDTYWWGLFYGLLYELQVAKELGLLPDAIDKVLQRELPDHSACGCCIYGMHATDLVDEIKKRMLGGKTTA